MQRVCIFGDSLAVGFCDNKGGWVNRLQSYLNLNFKDIIIYNLGISGNSTNDLLKRFTVECEARSPELIIFAIGIKDSQYFKTKNDPRVTMDKFKQNLNELISLARKYSNKIIFIGLTKVDESKTMPVLWNAEEYSDNENIEKYDQAIEQICNQSNLYYIHLFDLLDCSELHDGLHPNSKGHQKVFEKVKDYLIEQKII